MNTLLPNYTALEQIFLIMSDLCIPFLHNFHLKNPFVVYKRVYVKDPKFLEVLWTETETESRDCRLHWPGFRIVFLPVGFMGCSHVDFTLNFLQTRMKTGFRQTYSEDWTQQLYMCHRCTQAPALFPECCPLPVPSTSPQQIQMGTFCCGVTTFCLPLVHQR